MKRDDVARAGMGDESIQNPLGAGCHAVKPAAAPGDRDMTGCGTRHEPGPDSQRRPEEPRPQANGLLDRAVGAIQLLPPEIARAQETQPQMIEAVTCDQVTFLVCAPDEGRVLLDMPANYKECRPHIQVAQNVQDFIGGAGGRSVIKRQGNPGQPFSGSPRYHRAPDGATRIECDMCGRCRCDTGHAGTDCEGLKQSREVYRMPAGQPEWGERISCRLQLQVAPRSIRDAIERNQPLHVRDTGPAPYGPRAPDPRPSARQRRC